MADGATHAHKRFHLNALQMARSDLISYQIGMNKNYRAGLHHRVIAMALMELEAGRIDRLMIEAPPRHGKTRQLGVDFPSWCLGRHPDWNIGYATYNKDRAADVGFEVRENFTNSFHQRCFPAAKIDRLSNSSTKFSLRKVHTATQESRAAGGYKGVGMGGSMTGRGFDMLVLDDLVKDRESVDSPKWQNRFKNWFSGVATTRLEGLGAIASMMTRWGDSDPHGYIQREYVRDGWVILRMPALADPGDFLARPYGEALWPERFPKEKLERIQQGLIPRDWMALYQQSPTDLNGLFFDLKWFQWYDIAPARMNIYATGDYAVTEDQSRDFTEIYIWGIDDRGHIWLLDGYFAQVTPDKWSAAELGLVQSHRPRLFFKESGVIRQATESLIKTIRKEQQTPYCKTIWLPTIADKAANVTSFQARCAMGMVHLPKTPLGRRLAEQLKNFPTGLHDDGVDACGLLGRGLDMMMRAEAANGGLKTKGIRPFSAEWLHYVERDDDGLRDT